MKGTIEELMSAMRNGTPSITTRCEFTASRCGLPWCGAQVADGDNICAGGHIRGQAYAHPREELPIR